MASGVISIGVGDSMASLVGKKYGPRKILGTLKSLEGLLSFVFSCLTVVIFIGYFWPQWIFKKNTAFIACQILSYIIGGLMETFSAMNDNLCVPMIVYGISTLAS